MSPGIYIAILYTDPKLVDQLLSPSLLHFLKTGADHHALSIDDDLDNDFEVLFIILYFFIHDQVSRGKYGLCIDADVGLWLEKRQLDGEPDLDTVRNASFVIIDSSLLTTSTKHSSNIQGEDLA